MAERPILFDASRLIWRVWTGRLPTGIDRVCFAYLDHFGPRAQAVVQRGPLRLVLSPGRSQELFALLRMGGPAFRGALVALLVGAAASSSWQRGQRDLRGAIYLNIGHTGLDYAGLPGWLRQLGVKPVFLIHDLIPITHPEYCRAGEEARHRARMHNVLRSARGVIANSATTRDDLAHFAAQQGVPCPEVLIAWLGADRLERPASLPKRPRPYFVMIGTIEARKNHQLLLDVWRSLVTSLHAAAPDLLIIGQRGWEADEVFAQLDGDAELADHVHELGRCDDAMMAALLDGARALLMPSFVEGFGIPVIEALQRGVPVIASDLPVFREISSEIPLFLPPTDPAAWQAAVQDFAGDSAERTRQLALMPAYRAPDWPGHFAKVEAWLKRI